MGQRTIYSTHGWLPYGVTDDSILLQVAMTSLAEMSAISATSSVKISTAPNPSFDSVKGMICDGTSLGWHITELTGYAGLDNEGQISIEVESSAFTTSLDVSTGDDTSGNANDPTVLGFKDAGGTNFGSVFMINNVAQGTAKVCSTNFDGGLDSSRDHQYDAAINSSTPTNAPCYFHSEGKPEFSIINVGWRGNQHWLAVNGKMIMMESFTPHANYFANIYIGNYIGGAGYKMGDWYVRKLQISNRAPTFPVHPQLRRVITWSDSLFERTDSYASATTDFAMDNTVNAQIRQELGNRGLYCGWLDSDINDSYGFVYPANKFSSVVASIVAQRPDIVVVQGGTNDASSGDSVVAADFLDTATHGYKAIIDELDTVCTHIIVCTVPPRTEDTAAIQNAIDRMNTAIKTLPSYNSKVVVADVFTAMGGRNASTDLFFDTPARHMNGKGMYTHGQEVAKAFLKVIGT